jgi:hypothetical protein
MHYSSLFSHIRKMTIFLVTNKGPEYDGVRTYVRKQVETSFMSKMKTHRPLYPRILEVAEGSSMARWLTCRLIPSHKDAPPPPPVSSIGCAIIRGSFSIFHRYFHQSNY